MTATKAEFFKVYSSKEPEYAGLGIDRTALYGYEKQYYATREGAEARVKELNNSPDDDAGLNGTYSVVVCTPGLNDHDDECFNCGA